MHSAERALVPASDSVRLGAHWTELETPVVIVDEVRLVANIEQMAALAARNDVGLRPHVKAHRSSKIAALQLKAGAIGLAVARVDEAIAMQPLGSDVLLAHQVVSAGKLSRLLSDGTSSMKLGVDSVAGARILSSWAVANRRAIDVVIEIDSGLHRCGVAPDRAREVAEEIDQLPCLTVRGVFTHAGHAYGASDADELVAIANREATSCLEAANALAAAGFDVTVVSVGSTPTVAIAATHRGVTEIRPGNYIFNDAIQVALGVSSTAECALTVAATIISRPEPTRVVVDAGTKALGLDRGAHSMDRVSDYGRSLDGSVRLVRMSEEHGVAEVEPDARFVVGDRIRILPNHACTVVNLFHHAVLVRDNAVVDTIALDASARAHG